MRRIARGHRNSVRATAACDNSYPLAWPCLRVRRSSKFITVRHGNEIANSVAEYTVPSTAYFFLSRPRNPVDHLHLDDIFCIFQPSVRRRAVNDTRAWNTTVFLTIQQGTRRPGVPLTQGFRRKDEEGCCLIKTIRGWKIQWTPLSARGVRWLLFWLRRTLERTFRVQRRKEDAKDSAA